MGFLFVLGLIIGSFLNVCIHRFPRDESITGRSQCPYCGETIAWYDNIPLVSQLVLGGACRHCGEPISGQYFLMELVSGLVFGGCAWWWLTGTGMDWINFAVTTVLIVLSFAITLVDLEFSIIPNEFNYFLLLTGLAVGGIPHYPFVDESVLRFDPHQLGYSLIGMLVGGGLFFFLAVISPYIYGQSALGMGDVKLIAAYGLWMGPKLVLFTIVFGALIGAVVGSLMMFYQGKSLRTEIPFGPYLCLAAVIALIWGHDIVAWYLNLTRVGAV